MFSLLHTTASLLRSSRASQHGWQRVRIHTVSVPETSAPSQQHGAPNTPGPRKDGPVFLRVPKQWWCKNIRPVSKIRSKMNSAGPPANCPCPYSSAEACQGLPGMTQEGVTMGDPIPLQTATKSELSAEHDWLLQHPSTVSQESKFWKKLFSSFHLSTKPRRYRGKRRGLKVKGLGISAPNPSWSPSPHIVPAGHSLLIHKGAKMFCFPLYWSSNYKHIQVEKCRWA